MSSQEEEEIPDPQLSLDCGNHADELQTLKPQTPHIPREDAEEKQLSEHFTSETLFLSRTKLEDVAECILKNGTLKNLYLEGNRMSNLPDSMFTSLPNLLWLDLRNNQIASLPAEIGSHRALKTLLLEGNPISELPPELGNVITLKALNLRNCPIHFPPQDIVHQGLPCILQYLRSAMAERPVSVQKSHPDMPPVEKLQLSEMVRSSMEEEEDEAELQRFRELKHKMILMDRAELGYRGPVLPVACPARKAQGDGNLKSYPLPVIKRKKEITKANIISELPPFDILHWNRSEERRLAAMKRLKEKPAILEQRKNFRKQGCIVPNCRFTKCQTVRDQYYVSPKSIALNGDRELLQEWRTQAKIMQERKMLEHKQEMHEKQMRQEAPETNLYTANSEHGVADRSDPPQRVQRPLGSQKECEEARAARDRALEQRIRAHIQMMQQRCRRPRATAAEETAAAEQDMDETRKLHAELQERKRGRDVEYRFIAFTGDSTQRFFHK